MTLELTLEERALVISALTTKIHDLKAKRDLFVEQGMQNWVVDVDSERVRCVNLREKIITNA